MASQVLGFIDAVDKAAYVLDLYDKWVVHNEDFPPRADVSFLLRQTVTKGGKVLLEGPQSYFLSNQAEKFWDSGTSAFTDAVPTLTPARTPISATSAFTDAVARRRGARHRPLALRRAPASPRVP